MTPRKPKLTDADNMAIRQALRADYENSMRNLDMIAPWGMTWLKFAGHAWDAYRAFCGHTMQDVRVQR